MGRKKFDAALHLQLWQKAVDVQMHFNDIGWRIRALGLTVLTFTFGAIGVVYSNSETLLILGRDATPAFLVPIVGFMLWVAFWFTDAGWYHKLLVGSVKDAMRLEKLLNANGVNARLGKTIGEESPIRFYKPRSWNAWKSRGPRKAWMRAGKPVEMHSKVKLHAFYGGIALLLLATSALLLLAPPPADEETAPAHIENKISFEMKTLHSDAPAEQKP